jgi:hypothetical protein
MPAGNVTSVSGSPRNNVPVRPVTVSGGAKGPCESIGETLAREDANLFAHSRIGVIGPFT